MYLLFWLNRSPREVLAVNFCPLQLVLLLCFLPGHYLHILSQWHCLKTVLLRAKPASLWQIAQFLRDLVQRLTESSLPCLFWISESFSAEALCICISTTHICVYTQPKEMMSVTAMLYMVAFLDTKNTSGSYVPWSSKNLIYHSIWYIDVYWIWSANGRNPH